MAFVTYKAPKGDDRVVTFLGVEFFDGQAVEVSVDEHAHLIHKAKVNPHFEVSDESPKRGPGRPPKGE